jgi:hypothetical protein
VAFSDPRWDLLDFEERLRAAERSMPLIEAILIIVDVSEIV